MRIAGHAPEARPGARPDSSRNEPLGDLRFCALLADAAWMALPLPVRRRFSKRLCDGNTAVYVGEVLETYMSRAGWALAQAARLIGGPLPTGRETHVPSVVTVTEDMGAGGQIWTRLYARRRGFPQVIHSSKRFSGPTGLEEHVGCGIGMALDVSVEQGVLVFRSHGYFVQVAGRRIAIPAWATPGALTVTHAEVGGGRFIFTLEIVHPRLGVLLRQCVRFQEAGP